MLLQDYDNSAPGDISMVIGTDGLPTIAFTFSDGVLAEDPLQLYLIH